MGLFLVDNAELVRRVTAKYPVYRTWFASGELEKLRVPNFIPEYTARAAGAYDKAVADDPAAEVTVDVKGTDGISLY
jgi:hypothetical protein